MAMNEVSAPPAFSATTSSASEASALLSVIELFLRPGAFAPLFLFRQCALVPVAYGAPGHPAQQGKNGDAGRAQQHQRREEAGHLEAVIGFENARRKPCLRPTGASNEFSGDGTDEGEAAADADPRQEERQGRR